MIAFYGMGLLGSNFVRACLRRGDRVNVWNRNAERASALAEAGAVPFADAGEAARGAERVHLTLSDDAAVDDVLERLRPGLAKDAVIVDHTTTSPTGTRARATLWAERGISFQHAPVFMGPSNALDGTGVMLASGDRRIFDALSPELSKMTGKLLYLGADSAKAASFKLLGNSFLMFLTAGLADFFALAEALGVAKGEAGELFQTWNPGAALDARVARILAADFAHPSWELAMARKDARLMMDEAALAEARLAFIPAIAEEMDRFIERGHAKDDWTVIAGGPPRNIPGAQ
jgi:3-hydroxyisobutyrate dehydrogenase